MVRAVWQGAEEPQEKEAGDGQEISTDNTTHPQTDERSADDESGNLAAQIDASNVAAEEVSATPVSPSAAANMSPRSRARWQVGDIDV